PISLSRLEQVSIRRTYNRCYSQGTHFNRCCRSDLSSRLLNFTCSNGHDNCRCISRRFGRRPRGKEASGPDDSTPSSSTPHEGSITKTPHVGWMVLRAAPFIEVHVGKREAQT